MNKLLFHLVLQLCLIATDRSAIKAASADKAAASIDKAVGSTIIQSSIINFGLLSRNDHVFALSDQILRKNYAFAISLNKFGKAHIDKMGVTSYESV